MLDQKSESYIRNALGVAMNANCNTPQDLVELFSVELNHESHAVKRAAKQETLRIGRAVNKAGGKQLMHRVFSAVKDLDFKAGYALNDRWDGIGTWAA